MHNNTGQLHDDAHLQVPRIGRAPVGSDAERLLARLWETAPGWRGWLSTVDHKTIGLRYIYSAFVFLLMGGVEALIMRIQLAAPNQTILTPEQYSQLFTMHGVTMIFLYALPVLSGFSNYLWPLLLGARDMAFPRLNALSYWLFLFAGVFLYASFPLGQALNAGWFNYVPFSGPEFNTGPNIDVYALGMVLLGLSTTVGAINFVVTLFKMRAPGMSIDRVPILVWGTLTASVANLIAIPSVSLAFLMLWMDRQIGTHFYDVVSGGKPLLWQHLLDNWFAPNLTGDVASGLGRWSETDIVSFLKTGQAEQGIAFGSMISVIENSTQFMQDEDLRAIAHYLKSLPATGEDAAFQPDAALVAIASAAILTGRTERPGVGLYLAACAKCHQADGSGKKNKFPKLAGSAVVLSDNATSLIRLVLEGSKTVHTVHGTRAEQMPGFEKKYTDQEIADLLSFIRASWGNRARPVSEREVTTLHNAIRQ